MNYISVFSGCGGMDLGLEKAGLKCKGQIEIMPYALKVLNKHYSSVPKHTDVLTFCVQDGLVRIIQSQVTERVTRVKKVVSGVKLEGSLEYSILNGLCSKMFPDFSLSTMGKTSGMSYPTSIRSGIVWRGMCWTPRTLEWHNEEKECSLSEVLETSVPQKYYLSRKAVAGMIRRSKKWGRGGYVFLQKRQKGETRQIVLLSLQQFYTNTLAGVFAGPRLW